MDALPGACLARGRRQGVANRRPIPARSAAQRRGEVAVTAVWSRTEPAAASLAADMGGVPAFGGEEGLEAVLADDAAEAVLLILPVQALADAAERALAAGKHVLQEKPVAATVTRAAAVRAVAAANPSLVLAVAENYRSEPGVLAAATAAATVGDVTGISLVANMPMNEANRYFSSAWRRDAAGCPGVFLMDSSVHFVAALRSVAAAAGAGEAVRAGAVARGASPGLPAPDTLAGWVEFSSGGVAATLSISFAGAVPTLRLAADGAAGAVEIARGGFGGGGRGGGYEVSVARAGEAPQSTHHPFGGLEAELASFVRSVRGVATPADAAALCPVAAARDLAVVEALLASAAAGGAPVDVASVG